MNLYGLKNCDTCRKALKSMPDASLVDVRKDGVPFATLKQAYQQFGAALINTRSTTWRGLSDIERAQPPLELLAAHPTLMKRPLIAAGDALYLGWDNQVRRELGVS
ncbi:MAG: ArsC/Spx/MgsR family protein [Paracoccaceae bacterium]